MATAKTKKRTSTKKSVSKVKSNEEKPLEIGHDPIGRIVELWNVSDAWFVSVQGHVLDCPSEKEARELFEFRKHDANRNL